MADFMLRNEGCRIKYFLSIFDKLHFVGSYIQNDKKTETMSTKIKIKALVILGIMATSYSQANVQRHHIQRPARVVVVPMPKPHHVVSSQVSNHFNRKERLAMAIAYLINNRKITAKQYARITSLYKVAAETELDAFALDRKTPIRAIIEGKNKIYVMDNTIS